MEEKRTKLNALDSFMCFLYSLIMPIIFNVAFSTIIIVLSYISKVDYEVFTSQWLVKGISYILNSATFIAIFIYYYKKNSISFKETVNYRTNYNVWSVLIIVALSIVLVFGFTNFISLIDGLFAEIGYAPSGDLPFALNNVGALLLAIVLWALIPAICEELLFRGIIFKGLTTQFKPVNAMLIGGLCFMLMHGSLQQTIYQFILGIILCAVYYLTKNIFYPMLLHFLNNALVMIMEYVYQVSGFSFSSSFTTAWSFIWPILLMLLSVVIVIILVYLLQKINKNKYEHVVATEYEVMEKQVGLRLKKWIWISMIVAIVIWLANTISQWG